MTRLLINKNVIKEGTLYNSKLGNEIRNYNVTMDDLKRIISNAEYPMSIYLNHNKNSTVGVINKLGLRNNSIVVLDYDLHEYIDENKLVGMSIDGLINTDSNSIEKIYGVSLVNKPACKSCLVNENLTKIYAQTFKKSDNMEYEEFLEMFQQAFKEQFGSKFEDIEAKLNAIISQDKSNDETEKTEDKEKETDAETTLQKLADKVSTFDPIEIKKSILDEVTKNARVQEITNYITDLAKTGLIRTEDIPAQQELAAGNFEAYKDMFNDKIAQAKIIEDMKLGERESQFVPIKAESTDYATSYEKEHEVSFDNWDADITEAL